MKIGFSMEADTEQQSLSEVVSATNTDEETPVRSVVTVLFENGKEYPYYNDCFCLHIGDFVYVEGKLAGLPGRIVDYTEEFCVNLKYYKRVIQKVTAKINGTFQKLGCCLISNDCTVLPPAQIKPWFYPPQNSNEQDEFVYGKGISLTLKNFAEMDNHKTGNAYRNGIDAYYDNFLRYLSFDGKNGFAVVKTENEPTDYVTVTFQLEDGQIHTAFCTCITPGYCSHLSTVIYAMFVFLENEYLQTGNGGFVVIQNSVFEKFVSADSIKITVENH